jgi:hypothetical protein
MSYTTEQLKQIARQKARDFGVNEDIFLRVIQKESAWNPNATSEAGAQGLGQLMPETAREVGVANPYDPVQSLTGSARYLSRQLKRFGDYSKALAAYNAGPGNVEHYGGIPPFSETQNYVKTILGDQKPVSSTPASEQTKTNQTTTREDKGNRLLNTFIDLLSITGGRIIAPQSSVPKVDMPSYEKDTYSPQEQELDIVLNAVSNQKKQEAYEDFLEQESLKALESNMAAAERAKSQLLAQALNSFSTPSATI